MQKTWWKEAVVYQIYPRSFMDSNADGVGDLGGIIQKLDYLQKLGVDVVWLSPVYQSPNYDNGYDVSDYQAISAEYGTLADWEALLAGLHERGIRLVMDLVVNHTSHEHAWFRAARQSKDNPYRDYYIWRPGKDGREPNNWRAFFGGSAWTYDELTGEYYLHLFTPQQPDLNWENPKVRAEIYAMMHWWLDKGVDGFRMDVINMLSKVPGLPDAPVLSDEPYQLGVFYFINGPRLMDYLHEMKREVLDHYDLMTVGETPLVDTEDAIRLAGETTGPLNMVFQFQHMALDMDSSEAASRHSVGPWKLADLKQVMTRWQVDLHDRAWNSIYLGNHDQPRPVSRFGDDQEYRVESAKLLATFTHLLQGTPYIYQGEEIGMTNVAFDSIDDYRDVETLNMYREFVEQRGMTPQAALAIIHAKSRDNARTPVQWDAGPNAGFTSGAPWIRINPNYPAINVAASLADPDSVFYYYQKLIRLRRQHPVMVYGKYELILAEHPQIYAFTRALDQEKLLVMLNFSPQEARFELPAGMAVSGVELLVANYEVEGQEDLERLRLRPYEARVYRLT